MRAVVRASCAAVSACFALAFVACASSDEELAGAVPPGPDAGPAAIPQESDDAAAVDATTADASKDDGDAGRRTCSDDGFCHTELPPDQDLRGVWGDGTGVVWAVSEDGKILRWDGSAWSIHTTVAGTAFSAIWGSGPTDIWVAGTGGLMHGTSADASANGAVTFASVDAPGDRSIVLTSIWGTGPSDVWAVGGTQSTKYPYPVTGRVVHYTGAPGPDAGADGADDAGTASVDGWILEEPSATPVGYQSIWGTPNGALWVQGLTPATPQSSINSAVLRRKPGHTEWEPVTLPPEPGATYGMYPRSFTAAGASSDGSIWLVGITGGFTKAYWHGTSTDGGETYTWSFVARDPWDLDLFAFWGTGPNDTWAAGDYGRLRHWDGTEWTQAAIMVTSAPVKLPLRAVWGTSTDDLWAVGDGIALHKKAH